MGLEKMSKGASTHFLDVHFYRRSIHQKFAEKCRSWPQCLAEMALQVPDFVNPHFGILFILAAHTKVC